MVCFNKNLPINLKQMKKVLLSEIDHIIDDKLYFLDIIFESLKNDLKKDEDKYNNKIKKFKDNIIKEISNKFNSDYFLYKIMDDNHCTFKHKRGKRESEFCCKKITNNGDKKKYLCTNHNPKHIPQPKVINKNIESIKDNTNIEVLSSEDTSSITNINDNIKNRENITLNKNIYRNNKINKIYLYNKNMKLKNNSKQYISNSNNNIYPNVICNSFDSIKNICKNIINHKVCDFKHINNNISIIDFIK